jgi:hypothetical protein
MRAGNIRRIKDNVGILVEGLEFISFGYISPP